MQRRVCARLPWVVTIQLRLAELASASQDCKFLHFDELLFRYQYPSVLEPVRLEIPIRIETIELRGTGRVVCRSHEFCLHLSNFVLPAVDRMKILLALALLCVTICYASAQSTFIITDLGEIGRASCREGV